MEANAFAQAIAIIDKLGISGLAALALFMLRTVYEAYIKNLKENNQMLVDLLKSNVEAMTGLKNTVGDVNVTMRDVQKVVASCGLVQRQYQQLPQNQITRQKD